MKTLLKIIVAVCTIAAAMSCNKVNTVEDKKYIDNDIVVAFEVPGLELEQLDTKVYDESKYSKRYFHWEESDALVLFSHDGSTSGSGKNISKLGRFEAVDVTNTEYGATSAKFVGTIAAGTSIYSKAYAIYPYNDNIAFNSAEATTSQGYKIYCTIPEVQTGNAVEHAFFAAKDIPITKDKNGIITGIGPFTTFILSTPITLFKVKSSKDVVKIEIETENCKGWTGTASFRTNAGSVYDRGSSNKLTIMRGQETNLETLVPANEETPLSYAARQFEPLGTVGNVTYTESDIVINFKFIASDGSYCIRKWKPGKKQAAATVINLGTIEVGSAANPFIK